MSKNIITVQGLSKRYHLGLAPMADTLGGLLKNLVKAPWRRLRHLAGRAHELEFKALDEVNFSVGKGEVVGIIGRNGAGKSTLLKVLSRITPPTSGEVRLRGRVSSLLEVGTGFHPELTGRENIFLNGAIIGMSRKEIQDKFDDIVTFAEIHEFLDTPVKRYSSGMYVRLAFAVAAHLEPEILVIDEVLAVGDVAFQQKCLGKMKDVAGAGRTVLFVSHNMAAVSSLCSRAIVLSHGKVVFDGDQNAAIEHYYSSLNENEMSGTYQADPDHPQAIVKKMWMENTDRGDLPPGYFRINDRMRLQIECEIPRGVTDPGIGVGIEHIQGIRVFTIHTKCDPNFDVRHINGKVRVECDLENVALYPGKYFLRVNVSAGDKTLELIDSALEFTVIHSDYYGNSGKQLAGVVLVRQNWRAQELVAVADGEI